MANVWTLALAIVGLAISSYLSYTEKKHKQLVCVMGEDCNKVVKSRYGRIFGVPNAYLGIPYYLLIAAISFLIINGTINLLGISLHLFLLVLSAVGVVIYSGLVYTQFYKIGSWCGYCIASALTTIGILIIEVKLL